MLLKRIFTQGLIFVIKNILEIAFQTNWKMYVSVYSDSKSTGLPLLERKSHLHEVPVLVYLIAALNLLKDRLANNFLIVYKIPMFS